MEPRLSMNFLSMIETRLIPRTNENLDASFFFSEEWKRKRRFNGRNVWLVERERGGGKKTQDQEGKEIVSRLEN